MKVFIECTCTRMSRNHTGIQRVVRNLVNHLGDVPFTDATFIPVYFDGDDWYRSGLIHIKPPPSLPEKISLWLKRYFGEIGKAFLLFAISVLPLESSKYAFRTKWQERKKKNRRRAAQDLLIQFSAGDILVLLDSSWDDFDWFVVEELRHAGILIISVFYDLVPVSNPELCDGRLKDIFVRWAKNAVRKSDYALAISKSTAKELERFSLTQSGQLRTIDYFYLGSNLDGAREDAPIRPFIQDVFADGQAVFLVVGTIEPRKNHAFILDGFKRYAQVDAEAKLLIVGKYGWMADQVVARLQAHDLYGSRLLWIQDATDSELEFMYRKSRALIFASIVEGFGLPLIEARQRGLPVVASDIPVFQEIADEFVHFFKLNDEEDFCRALTTCPMGNKPLHWNTWREATQEFCEKILAFKE